MSRPPFTKEEMFTELREVVRVMANHIAQYGSSEAAQVLTGFEADSRTYPYAEEALAKFDLSRFSITPMMSSAYDYAFQVGLLSGFGDADAQDINEFRFGANMQMTNGYGSPMANADGMCRTVTDLAFARWQLECGFELTIRELALLSGLKEPAVRNSLSAESIRVETGRPGQPGTIAAEAAYGWLRKRRGFVDSCDPETRAMNRRREFRSLFRDRSFSPAFNEVLQASKISLADLAQKASVDPSFIQRLLDGNPPLDVEAARRVGQALDLDVPSFAGAVVEEALRGASA